MNCRWCGIEIQQARTGRPRLYCSSQCRVAAHRARNLEKFLTVRAENPDDPVVLSDTELVTLDLHALELKRDLLLGRMDSTLADIDLVDAATTTGRASWRYEDSSLAALRTLNADPWFDFD